jgi:hypothetical protein
VKWHLNMGVTILKVFGENSLELKRYRSASDWGRPIGGLSKAAVDSQTEERFDEMLSSIRGWVDALISQIERFGIGPTGTIEGVPKRYALTSPVFLAEWLWGTLGLKRLFALAWIHKVVSFTFVAVTVAGSIFGILTGLGVL